LIGIVDSAKILGFFPLHFYSHERFHFGILKLLAERGHNLTIFSPKKFDTNNVNVTQIIFDTQQLDESFSSIGTKDWRFFIGDMIGSYHLLRMLISRPSDRNFQEFVKKGKKGDFDLIIMESCNANPFHVLGDIFDCPIILSSPFVSHHSFEEALGLSSNPAIYPENTTILAWRDGTLNFWQRLLSVVQFYGRKIFTAIKAKMFTFYVSYNGYLNVTSLNSKNRIAMLFMSSLTSFRPRLPNIVSLSFMQVSPPSTLPDNKIKSFLDGAVNGTILISFGTISKSKDLSLQMIEAFLKTFRSLKYHRFLWKFEGEIENSPENLLISNWLPQGDILAHPNLIAFISHGGIASVHESIDREVPMVIIPISSDQPSNGEYMKEKRCALTLDWNELTEKSLTSAIREILKPEYKDNIKNLKRLMLDKPISDRDLVVWNVEYVIRNKGADFYQSKTKDVPVYQQHHIDIHLFLVMFCYLMTKIFKLFFRFITKLKNYKMEFKSRSIKKTE
jgi:hypothetical protein